MSKDFKEECLNDLVRLCGKLREQIEENGVNLGLKNGSILSIKPTNSPIRGRLKYNMILDDHLYIEPPKDLPAK